MTFVPHGRRLIAGEGIAAEATFENEPLADTGTPGRPLVDERLSDRGRRYGRDGAWPALSGQHEFRDHLGRRDVDPPLSQTGLPSECLARHHAVGPRLEISFNSSTFL